MLTLSLFPKAEQSPEREGKAALKKEFNFPLSDFDFDLNKLPRLESYHRLKPLAGDYSTRKGKQPKIRQELGKQVQESKRGYQAGRQVSKANLGI